MDVVVVVVLVVSWSYVAWCDVQIAMISPGMNCCEHTLNTLRYADRWVSFDGHFCISCAYFECFTDVSRTITFPDRRFPDKTFPGQDISRTRPFPDNHFPRQTFPGQVILRNFHVHSVCKYQLCRLSHKICRYTERLLMCACRPAVSIRGLFGKACSPTMGKA